MSLNQDNLKSRFPLDEARAVLFDAIRNRVFPGCAFGVLVRDEVAACEGLGEFIYHEGASSDLAAARVHAETVYDLASVTKVVATTAMAMILHERTVLKLDQLLGELLPGFVVGRSDSRWARAVTLRHLLAHSSGLPGYRPLFRSEHNAGDLLRACLTMPLEAEPGTRAEYSDHGFILLGKALEVLTGESVAQWTKREIFAPLGMERTGFCPDESMRAAIPPTEDDRTFRHRRVQGEVQDEHAFVMGGVAGHAGLFSNVPDLLRFSAAMLQSGRNRLVSEATVQLFSERQAPVGSSRALGWDTPSAPSSSGDHFSPHSIGHLGYSGCSLWIDLEAQVAVVLLTNRTWPDRKTDAIRQLRPEFHNAVRKAIGL